MGNDKEDCMKRRNTVDQLGDFAILILAVAFCMAAGAE